MKYKLSEDELGLLSDLRRGNIPLDEEVLEEIRGSSRGLSVFQAGGSLLDNYAGGDGYTSSEWAPFTQPSGYIHLHDESAPLPLAIRKLKRRS